jgi:hypothetical protein
MTAATFESTQRRFTEHLRAPEGVAAPADVPTSRMTLYRELVYGNVERMIENLFPVLRKITPDPTWFALVHDFFQRHQCRTGLFTQLPHEFLQFVQHARAAHDDPPYWLELVHYESTEYAVSIDPRDPDWTGIDPGGDLLDGAPVLSPLARVLAYRYPVQKIGPHYVPDAAPDLPTWLVVCRDRDDKVGFIELNPVSARLLELVADASGLSGRAMLELIAVELAHPEPAAVVAGGLEILERLRARDVILGTRAPV